MRWVRSHVRFGSHLALFALAVQLVLSFAHIHLDDLGPGGKSIASANAVAAVPAAVADQPSSPSPKKSHSPADDVCAICSVLQLVAAAAQVSAPSLSIPIVSRPAAPITKIETELAALPQLSFRARGPPQA